MAYPYICDSCKSGDHANCEGAKSLPPSADSEVLLGGGVCVCPHDGVYATPDEVWRRSKQG